MLEEPDKLQAVSSDADATSTESLSPEEAEKHAIEDKRLVRKIDLILMPWLFLLLLVSYLDRTNIGNAKLYGLVTDLNMDDSHYHIALSLFYIFYAGFEPLTNILIKRLRPSIFIPSIMILWGISMACMGVVNNFSGLTAVRVFLGIFEAGLFPGICHYLSCWYKRSEVGVRIAFFFCASALAGSFGGLLAAALSNIHVGSGLFSQGWRWIFIVEGLFTVLIAVASFRFVKDYPDKAKFLSEKDHRRVLQRLRDDEQSSAEHEDFEMVYVWQSLRDWKTWMYCIVYMGCNMCLAAFSLFMPTIVNGLGQYSSTVSNLLTVPPYAFGALGTVFVGWLADRTRQRGLCNIGAACLGVAGFAILVSDAPAHVKYFATFLGAVGIYPSVANTISWVANNTEGTYKRGVTMGIVIGWGNLNGVVASNIYLSAESPRYTTGHSVVLGFLSVFLLGGSLFMHFALSAENKKRASGLRDNILESRTAEQIRLLGDKRPDFRFTV